MVSAFGRKGTLEVNPIDLIAVECLRVFEPSVYAALPEHKSLLTERQFDYGNSAELKQRIKASADEIVKVTVGNQEDTKYLLRMLFPFLESIWGNMSYGSDFYPVWMQQRRICSSDFFDRFFCLRLPTGQVSEATIQEILKACENRSELQNIFIKLEKDNLLLAAIERLGAEKSLHKLINPLPYLLALADLSDRLHRTRRIATLSHPGDIHVRWAVNRVLSNTKNSEAKINIIKTLICDSQSIALAAAWIDDVENPKENSDYPKIEGAELDTLKKRWLEKVRLAAKEGRLIDIISHLRWILSDWMKWADPSEAKKWVFSLSANPKEMLQFLKLNINEAQSQTIGSCYTHDNGWLSWKSSLELFQPQEKWGQIADDLRKIPNPSDDEKRTLRLFQAAMKRWQSGIEDVSPRTFEDLEQEP
jgi:predicted KAP-like P-loop ATPase